MKTEITKDEQCNIGRHGKLAKNQDIPFITEDDQYDIPCVHAHRFTAITSQDGDGPMIGIIAMATGNSGLLVSYNAADIRALASQLNRMADYMDAENAK